MKNLKVLLNDLTYKPVPALPFQVFRVVWGLLMFFSTARFIALGWIDDHFLLPIFHFKYWGFEWIEPMPAPYMYALHYLMLIAALGISFATGLLFRICAAFFFLAFTYTHLIDVSFYLNHYYFVSLITFLMCLIPSPPPLTHKGAFLPAWIPNLFKFQIALVYLYAGIAKIRYEWLIEGMPLKIWLPPHYDLPLIGPIFQWEYTPYLFAWAGMFYDCTIPFLLLYHKTRPFAYLLVIIFHTIVGLLFQIGIFPIVMIGSTLLFFDFKAWQAPSISLPSMPPFKPLSKVFSLFLLLYMSIQLLYPWRYVLYTGNLFWTEQGYRWGWRVMLMEKAGTATFFVKDTRTGREGIVNNAEFLTPHQEKQMAIQPDMILQYAHFLKHYYEQKGVYRPQVRAEVWITLNAKPSQLYFSPQLDLTSLHDTWKHKDWLYPYPYEHKNFTHRKDL